MVTMSFSPSSRGSYANSEASQERELDVFGTKRNSAQEEAAIRTAGDQEGFVAKKFEQLKPAPASTLDLDAFWEECAADQERRQLAQSSTNFWSRYSLTSNE